MKRLFLILALPLLLWACSSNDEPDVDVAKVYSIDTPYEFPDDETYLFADYDASQYNTLADRMSDLQIPSKQVGKMTSRALLETGQNHPLSRLFMFYNYPILWINYMMENFNGFVELQKREDCEAQALLFYEKYKAAYDDLCERIPDQKEWAEDEFNIKMDYLFAMYVAKYFQVISHDDPSDGGDDMYVWRGVNN